MRDTPSPRAGHHRAPGPTDHPTGPGPQPLVLASASPRRADILHTLRVPHLVRPADVDETEREGESPEAYAERMALEKAAAVAAEHPDAWLLASDTVVALEDRVLGKPRDHDHAVHMLLELAGRAHRVVSSVVLRAPVGVGEGKGSGGRSRRGAPGAPPIWSGVEATEVVFRPFGQAWAEAYAATGEPMDKAGAYGIQGLGAVLVERVSGDYSGVVGLPVSLLVRLFEEAGHPYRFPTP